MRAKADRRAKDDLIDDDLLRRAMEMADDDFDDVADEDEALRALDMDGAIELDDDDDDDDDDVSVAGLGDAYEFDDDDDGHVVVIVVVVVVEFDRAVRLVRGSSCVRRHPVVIRGFHRLLVVVVRRVVTGATTMPAPHPPSEVAAAYPSDPRRPPSGLAARADERADHIAAGLEDDGAAVPIPFPR